MKNSSHSYKQSFKHCLISLAMGFFVLAPTVQAASNVVAIEGASYKVDWPLSNNLKTFMGKKITLHLKSGVDVTGTVKAVGNDLVHIEKLSNNKEFYDALIRVSEVNGITARFREFKR